MTLMIMGVSMHALSAASAFRIASTPLLPLRTLSTCRNVRTSTPVVPARGCLKLPVLRAELLEGCGSLVDYEQSAVDVVAAGLLSLPLTKQMMTLL